MRLHHILSEAELQQLDEITRRGFLKGIGAAAGLAATGAMAAPFKHGQNVDPMDNKPGAKTATVKSNDGMAELYIQYGDKSQPDGVWIDIKNGKIERPDTDFGRVKFSSEPVKKVWGGVDRNSGFKSAQLGGSSADETSEYSTSKLARKILSHSGELKVEIPVYGKGKVIYIFTIEPDETSKQTGQKLNQKAKASQDSAEQEKKRKEDEFQQRLEKSKAEEAKTKAFKDFVMKHHRVPTDQELSQFMSSNK
jgi:hypothetical protein